MKGNFIKKLTAYALTAAMVMSTPMTAFASEFADNFWYADGSDDEGGNHKEDGGPSGTGTVTSTNTTSLAEWADQIKGIAIDHPSVVLDLTNGKNQEKLTAKILGEDGKELNLTPEAKKAICSRIEWSTSNYSVVRPKVVNAQGRENCWITGYKGGFATITAGINLSGATGKDKEYDYVAKCRVMVKKAADDFTWNIATTGDSLYAGHTYDLQDYITFIPADAYEKATFKVENLNSKFATFDEENGILSIVEAKKLKAKDEHKVKITATLANGKSHEVEVTLAHGNPVKSLNFKSEKSKAKYDIGEKKYNKTTYEKLSAVAIKESSPTLKVTIAGETKNSTTTTDDLAWTSSDSRIVRVRTADGKNAENVKTDIRNKNSNRPEGLADDSPLNEVIFEGMSVGKADITVKATNGKKATFKVTVTANLMTITDVYVSDAKNSTTYSGKTTQLVMTRVPAENKDKITVKVVDRNAKKIVKAKAGVTPTVTPIVDLSKSKLTLADDNSYTVAKNNVTVEYKVKEGKKTVKKSEPVNAFTIKQSDTKIKDDAVSGFGSTNLKATKTVNVNSNRSFVCNVLPAGPDHWNPGEEAVSWVSSKDTVATVENGKIKVIGDGSAKITVSSVWLDPAKNNKATTAKATFTVKSTPKCEQIELKSNTVTVKKGKKATVQIKQQLPKKAADKVSWYYIKTGKDGEETLEAISGMQNVDMKKGKKLTIDTSSYAEGDIIRVLVTTGAAEVEAKVVVTPAK